MSTHARNKYIGNSCVCCAPVLHKGRLPAIWNPADAKPVACFTTKCNKKPYRSLWHDIISEKRNEPSLMRVFPVGLFSLPESHVCAPVRLGRGSKILRAIISDSGPGLYAQKREFKRVYNPNSNKTEEKHMNNYKLITYKKGGKYMIPNNARKTEEYLAEHCSLFVTEHLVNGDWGRTYHRYRLRTCEPTRFTDTLE